MYVELQGQSFRLGYNSPLVEYAAHFFSANPLLQISINPGTTYALTCNQKRLMTIAFHGAARTVTGSKHLITLDNGKKILFDCGLFQGMGQQTDELNRDFGFSPADIDYLLLSHAKILQIFFCTTVRKFKPTRWSLSIKKEPQKIFHYTSRCTMPGM